MSCVSGICIRRLFLYCHSPTVTSAGVLPSSPGLNMRLIMKAEDWRIFHMFHAWVGGQGSLISPVLPQSPNVPN